MEEKEETSWWHTLHNDAVITPFQGAIVLIVFFTFMGFWVSYKEKIWCFKEGEPFCACLSQRRENRHEETAAQRRNRERYNQQNIDRNPNAR